MAAFALWDAYLYLIIISPVGPSRFGLSEGQITMIRLTIAVPYLIMWLAGIYAFVKLHSYTQTIKDSPESEPFKNFATGTLILLSSLVLATVISGIKGLYIHGESIIKPLTILGNYAYVWPLLIAVGFFFRASRRLLKTRQRDHLEWQEWAVFLLPLAIFAYFWLNLIFSNTARQATTSVTPATYYLNDSLIILTIVIPSLITWVVGVRSIVKVLRYNTQVTGVIYRQGLSRLAAGITGVIVGSILVQALQGLGGARLLKTGLGSILLIIYLFLVIQLIGYLFIANGAKRLTKIETI